MSIAVVCCLCKRIYKLKRIKIIIDYEQGREVSLTKASIDTNCVIILSVGKGKPVQQANKIAVADKSYKV